MNRKSKILISVVILLIIASVVATYYRIYIQKNYFILIDAPCDPNQDKCFEYQCVVGVDIGCSENPAEQITYFNYINKKAYDAVTCDSNDKGCSLYKCSENEKGCEVIFCAEKTKKVEEVCSSSTVQLNNSVEHPVSTE